MAYDRAKANLPNFKFYLLRNRLRFRPNSNGRLLRRVQKGLQAIFKNLKIKKKFFCNLWKTWFLSKNSVKCLVRSLYYKLENWVRALNFSKNSLYKSGQKFKKKFFGSKNIKNVIFEQKIRKMRAMMSSYMVQGQVRALNFSKNSLNKTRQKMFFEKNFPQKSLRNMFCCQKWSKTSKIQKKIEKNFLLQSIQNVSKRILKRKSQNRKFFPAPIFFSDLVIFWPK